MTGGNGPSSAQVILSSCPEIDFDFGSSTLCKRGKICDFFTIMNLLRKFAQSASNPTPNAQSHFWATNVVIYFRKLLTSIPK